MRTGLFTGRLSESGREEGRSDVVHPKGMRARLGLQPDFEISFASLWRHRRTTVGSGEAPPRFRGRDLPQAAAQPSVGEQAPAAPQPSIGEPAPARSAMPSLSGLAGGAVPTALAATATRLDALLSTHPQGAFIDAEQRLLLSAALERVCTGRPGCDPEAVARELLASGPDLLDTHGGDRASPHQIAAWQTIRALATAGASGAQLAAHLVGGDGAPADQLWLRTLACASDALDPRRAMSLGDLESRARTVDARITPLCQTPLDQKGGLPSQFQLKHWLSPERLAKEGVDEHAIRDRLSSVALLALLQQRDSPARPAWSQAQAAAVGAVRNGLTSEQPGSDLAFAEGRAGKLRAYARRVGQGVFQRLGRSNPFGPFVSSKPQDRMTSQLAGMRASKDAADHLSLVNTAIVSVARESGDSARLATAALDAERYAHWADRTLSVQQLDQHVEADEAHAIVERALDRMNSRGAERNAARADLTQRMTGWKMSPATLREAGAGLSSELASMAELVRAPESGSQTDEASRGFAQAVLHRLADTPTSRRASSTLRLGGVADAYRGRIEDAMAKLDLVEPQVHPEELARRRSDPIGALADAVDRFERGSSLTLSSGRLTGVNVPFALPSMVASHFGSPVVTPGRIGFLQRREATVSAALSSAGGEIFIGTSRARELDLAAGLGGGVPLGPVMVGLGGTLGFDSSRTIGSGLWLRIPRNGSVPGTPGPDGRSAPVPPGLDGDRNVAARMAEVLRAAKELGARDEPNLLLQLMARFPELSVSTTRDPGSHLETHPRRFRAEAGAGLLLPIDASRLTVAGANAGYERDPDISKRKIESGGRSNVSVRHAADTKRVFTGAGLVSAGRGLGEAVAVRSSILCAGASAESTLLIQDGAHGAASSLTRSYETLGDFTEDARRSIPELVKYGMTADRRVRELIEARHATVDGQVAREELTNAIRSERAAAYMTGIQAIAPTNDSRYTISSEVKPEARQALDNLHALRALTRDAPGLEAVHAACSEAYEVLAARHDAYSAAFAFQQRDQCRETSRGWPILVQNGRVSRINQTALWSVA